MAAQTLPTLIQPNEIVNAGILKAAPLNARFDVQLLAPHIVDAEAAHIIPVLGADLYAALKTAKAGRVSNYNTAIAVEVKAFPTTDDPKEALWTTGGLMTLCAWAVYYEALPFIAMQAGSNGVFTMNTEHGTNVGAAGVKLLQDTAKRRIAQQAERLRLYLCENADDFDDFDSDTNCPDCDGDGTPDSQVNSLGKFGLYHVTANNE